MFGSSINCVFVFLILLIFISTSVFGDCIDEQTCRTVFSTWCCSLDEVCGDYDGACQSDSNLSPAVIAIIIVASIFVFVICFSCCIRSAQQQQHSYANSRSHILRNAYQQSARQGPVRIVHVRPIYNVGAAPPSQSYPNFYEAPPPSYEAATANLPTIHQSPLPVTTTTLQ